MRSVRCPAPATLRRSLVARRRPATGRGAAPAARGGAGEGPAGAQRPPRDAAEGHTLAVFLVRRDTRCGACGRDLWRGNLLRVEGEQALCLDCADLGYLEYLPRGAPAVTRRARKYAALSAVVLEWSRTRKRYERQGLLTAPEAIRRAEQESLADAEWRARQRDRAAARREAEDEAYIAAFAAAVRTHFPGCPDADAAAIAAHACRRSSGRIGRSAAARALDPSAVHLAVLAHVRHVHTPYDRLLGQLGDRALARARVRPDVEAVLRRWGGRPESGDASDRDPG
jgi:hypothetical protein